jgi:hypothetical protein
MRGVPGRGYLSNAIQARMQGRRHKADPDLELGYFLALAPRFPFLGKLLPNGLGVFALDDE